MVTPTGYLKESNVSLLTYFESQNEVKIKYDCEISLTLVRQDWMNDNSLWQKPSQN